MLAVCFLVFFSGSGIWSNISSSQDKIWSHKPLDGIIFHPGFRPENLLVLGDGSPWQKLPEMAKLFKKSGLKTVMSHVITLRKKTSLKAGLSRTARANRASRRALMTVKTRMKLASMPNGSRIHFGKTPKMKTWNRMNWEVRWHGWKPKNRGKTPPNHPF